MAQVVLASVGAALGGPVGGAIGAAIGGAIDQVALNALAPARQVGPRLSGIRVTSTAEGAPMAAVFGRARVGGQVIWAANFRESRSTGGGGKAGPRTTSSRYSLSFAVALCEGPIAGVERIWADGKLMDTAAVSWRLHKGGEDQTPDALIAAVEGADAPAYRGTAYVVFEDLPLEPYGNRPPQLSFEVFRTLDEGGLERRLTSVCLIPGAGEFVLAGEPVLRRTGLTRAEAENVHAEAERADLLVSLDQLQAALPNVDEVLVVVAWFGDDLRAGECRVRPGVEGRDKTTTPLTWSVDGVERADAHLISQTNGRPNYGGTPSDESVLQAIAALKARGFKVGLYPFLLMDVPPDGPEGQPAFPWRGRITTDDGEGAAEAVERFFEGEDGFGRMVRHCADLAAEAGGVDTFLIGSELAALTVVRDELGGYPAVEALRTLAADCKGVLGDGCAVSYAADWTEYFGHQPADGSGDVHFHLDPLWADPNVDFVGIDWYAPLSDWRDGAGHLDREAGWSGPYDLDYLKANVAGGERFDWYYPSEGARTTQARAPITDGAYGEPWVIRVKDLVGWWSNAHYDRPGGVRSVEPTAWVPQSKPIRFVEFGCPAVDKGANAPNLFFDAKSSESGVPPFSSGRRDDLAQRQALVALLEHFDEVENNPLSGVYGGPMLAGMSAWCWDARPFPAFPALEDVWADGPNWTLGHWLNGRAGAAPTAELIRAVLRWGGVDPAAVDLSEAAFFGGRQASGYVIERPMRVRDALAPLAAAFAFDACEQDGRIKLAARDGPAATLDWDGLALEDGAAAAEERSRTLEPAPDLVRVRFYDEGADYQTGAAAVTADGREGGGAEDIDLPLTTGADHAEAVAARRLRRARAERETLTLAVGPLEALTREAGDRLVVEGVDGRWRVTRVDHDERPRLTLARAEAADAGGAGWPTWTPTPPPPIAPAPVVHVLDLPALPGAETDARPLIAAAAEPWRRLDVHAGPDSSALTVRARVSAPATLGVLVEPLAPGPRGRFDRTARLLVRLEGEGPGSRSEAAVLAGANALAVQAPGDEWELLQFLSAELVGPDVYALSGLLRAQGGTDEAAALVKPAGAMVVLLDEALARAEVSLAERGLPLLWRAARAGGPAGGPGSAEVEARWRGVQLRPWAPAHLSAAEQGDGSLRLSWVRRARLGGDGWGEEPPLVEADERYRVEALDAGGEVVRGWEVGATEASYAAADRAADAAVRWRVRQAGAVWGWGAPAEAALT